MNIFKALCLGVAILCCGACTPQRAPAELVTPSAGDATSPATSAPEAPATADVTAPAADADPAGPSPASDSKGDDSESNGSESNDSKGSKGNDSEGSERAGASPALAGRWSPAETADQKQRRLAAIDAATERLNPFQRGLARSQLAQRTAPPPGLMIEVEGSKLTIVNGERRLELELGGAPVDVAGPQGPSRVSATLEEERLTVTARRSTGERTTTYRADGAGLLMEVTMKSERLTGPVKYALTYARIE